VHFTGVIPRQLVSFFPPFVRERGDDYFASGRARIARANGDTIVALVTGSIGYAVDMHAAEGQILMSCTCPYADEHGICKHVWAALRQADEEGKLDPLIELAGPRMQIFAMPAGEDLDDVAPLAEGHEPPVVERKQPDAGEAERHRSMEWRNLLDVARRQMAQPQPATRPSGGSMPAKWPAYRRLVYVVDLSSTWSSGIVVDLGTERLRRDGSWDPPERFRFPGDVWLSAPDQADRQIAQMLLGATADSGRTGGGGGGGGHRQLRTGGFILHQSAFDTTLRMICETGRCRVRTAAENWSQERVRWDEGPPWRLRLRLTRENGTFILSGLLARDDDEMSLDEPSAINPEGVLFARESLARFDHGGAFALVDILRRSGATTVGEEELPELLEKLYALPILPPIDLPDGAAVAESREGPIPCLTIVAEPKEVQVDRRPKLNQLLVGFLYGTTRISGVEGEPTVFERDSLIVHHRRPDIEGAARSKLSSLGAREDWDYVSGGRRLVVGQSRLTPMVLDLVRSGWIVDAGGVAYRAPGEMRAQVRSGIDWFDLEGAVSYGDMNVPLHTLLEARRRGDQSITLDDGSIGILPVDWLARLGPAAAGGTSANGATRFTRSQVALLDALLATLPDVDVDATFEKARTELRSFDKIGPAEAPAGFVGTLREYQREGLGWLHFLRRFELGGCLADDMGLGKTIQVLALLESRREERQRNGPSIVVVPRSLVFNWIREAERFTPKLRLLDHTGLERQVADIDLDTADVVITTYGTLRRDAVELSGVQFDYAILDEAQAIKNAGTASAKAARLLKARYRLAVTGTPIENRLEELWSLFEFLNPGMLGGKSAFSSLVRLASAVDEEPIGGPTKRAPAGIEGGELLARALRPVILRRTKEKVATELPERTEQTLEVELEGAQRKFYDALLAEYRGSILERVDRVGIMRARMHILEGLLRLRQAACHPALADPRKASLPSAKLDALIPALTEIVEEGHKALVFSQFTSFLALVRERLDKEGIKYEYLDGKTRDRQARVDRFQSDSASQLFLISLKAGGQGLNLTAADYVFILDPWWNPAVEAQAIDRTHRIGQTRRVIATRLVARGTVEEKILDLQASKRSLADAILSADQGVLAKIGRSELEALLG
jgi:superfamily II DNA or RNA helicase